MFKKLWLTFTQAVVLLLACFFIAKVLRPEWLHSVGLGSLGVPGYRAAVETAMPAVVNIFTTQKNAEAPKNPFFDDPDIRKFFGEDFEDNTTKEDEPASSLGSGVIVDAAGYIVTNEHVVEGADEIVVGLFDGRTAKASLVGADPETDLAVLKINLEALPTIVFAQEENTRVGDVVLAMGNPFGVGQTVTMGIVSAMGRNQVGIKTFENFIQTDAAINPGNSGGALVDTQGRLLGINTAIYSRTGGSLGIGFAIPAKIVQNIQNQIVRNGAVTRGYIGIEQQNITPELAKTFDLPHTHGVLIAGVVKDGPADKAGIKVGDILLSIDGENIQDITEMLNKIAAYTPGQQKKVALLREGKTTTLSIEIGVRPKPIDLIKK